eukprot:Pgem_evm1s20256
MFSNKLTISALLLASTSSLISVNVNADTSSYKVESECHKPLYHSAHEAFKSCCSNKDSSGKCHFVSYDKQISSGGTKCRYECNGKVGSCSGTPCGGSTLWPVSLQLYEDEVENCTTTTVANRKHLQIDGNGCYATMVNKGKESMPVSFKINNVNNELNFEVFMDTVCSQNKIFSNKTNLVTKTLEPTFAESNCQTANVTKSFNGGSVIPVTFKFLLSPEIGSSELKQTNRRGDGTIISSSLLSLGSA